MDKRLTHNRRTIRYQGYDYSTPGGYFFTICTANHVHLFGDIFNDSNGFNLMRLNPIGKIVQETWEDLVNHIKGIELGTFQIMPNHIHGIVFIIGGEPNQSQKIELGEIVRQLKTFSARKINSLKNTLGNQVWQRNYYERVIRNDEELVRFQNYVLDNPRRWTEDPENEIG